MSECMMSERLVVWGHYFLLLSLGTNNLRSPKKRHLHQLNGFTLREPAEYMEYMNYVIVDFGYSVSTVHQIAWRV